MRRLARTIAAVALASVPLAGFTLLPHSQRAEAADAHVSIASIVRGFVPPTVTVGVGDTVTWTNDDPDALHNAICDSSCPEQWTSGPSAPKGSTGKHRFVKDGTYRYHCELHPNMVGYVIVTVAPPPASTSTTVPRTTSTTGHAASSTSSTAAGASSTTIPFLTPEPTTTAAGSPTTIAGTAYKEDKGVPAAAYGVGAILLLAALVSFVATRVGERRR